MTTVPEESAVHDRIDRQESAISDLRVGQARLEERLEAVLTELRAARRDREKDNQQNKAQIEALSAQLAPLTENVNRWKGAAAVLAIVAGAAGASATTVVKKMLGIL